MILGYTHEYESKQEMLDSLKNKWEEVEGGEHTPLDALRICYQALKELTDNNFIYGDDDSISFEEIEKILGGEK